jgi:spermidine synthase
MTAAGKWLASTDSAYQHVDLAQNEDQYTLYANGKVFLSFPDPYRNKPRTHLVMVQHEKPKSVLVIGSLYSGFAQTALLHPIDHLDLVQIDPKESLLIEPVISPAHKKKLKDPRLTIHPTDGRRFLARSSDRWDLIFVDSPDPSNANLNRYYTQEFFRLVQSRLNPQGVVAARVSSNVNYLGRQTATLVGSVQQTLESVFNKVVTLPGQEVFFFASSQESMLLSDASSMEKRYLHRGVMDPLFSHHQFTSLIQQELIEDLQIQLAQKAHSEINLDSRPATYLAYILARQNQRQNGSAQALTWLVQLPFFAWLAFIPGLLWLASLSISARRHKVDPTHPFAKLSVALVGAVGLAIELMLCFTYQSLAGNLYQEIGLLVAFFMSGLVLGAKVFQRHGEQRKRAFDLNTLSRSLWAMGAYCLCLIPFQASGLLLFLPMVVAQAWILFLILFAGIGTGMMFLLAAQVAMNTQASLAKVAGGLNGWDHVGAAIAALFTGVLAIPVGGQMPTCLLLSASLFSAGLLLASGSRLSSKNK